MWSIIFIGLWVGVLSNPIQNHSIQICPSGTLFNSTTLRCDANATYETVRNSFVCVEDGNFPIPGQCSPNYYICIDGVSYPASCPGENIFDSETLECTVPEAASCRRGTTQETASTTRAIFDCPSDGNFPIPGQCSSEYYICLEGSVYFGRCPGENVFDPMTLECSIPEAASCQRSTAAISTTSEPFSCVSDGYFAIPGQCSASYYICADGTAYLQNCPGMMIFDPVSLRCVDADEASCSASSSTNAHTTTIEPFTCPDDDGYFPSSTLCTEEYYICSDGVAHLQICPGSLIFDPVTLRCVLLEESSCQVDSTTMVTTSTGTSLAPFSCPQSDGYFPIPGQCSANYYICQDGIHYLQTCPGSWLFDPETLRCTSPEQVSCLGTTTVTPSVTTLPPFNCPEDGYFAVPGRCTANYYICVDGISYPETCPGQLLFDPLTLRCVSPEDVTCRTTTSSPSSSTLEPFSCPEPEGYFPIPGACSSSYYICAGGIPYLQTCPGGLIFDPISLKCTTAEQAHCGGSSTPGPTTTLEPFVCPESNGYFALPGQCGPYYYICVDGEPFLQTCPGQLLFDPVTLKCEPPESVSCLVTQSSTIERTTSTTTELATTTEKSTTYKEETTTEEPTTTATSTTITTQEPTTAEEPATTTEEPTTTTQEPNETTKDTTTISTEESTTTTEEPTATTTAETTTTEEPATTTTEEVTTTTTEEPTTITTELTTTEMSTVVTTTEPVTEEPTTTSTEQPTTDSAETTTELTTTTEEPTTTEVVTTEEPTTTTTHPTTTPTTTTESTGEFVCPDSNGVFPNPDDCGSFYICSNNTPVLQDCPSGLAFNPETGECDFPANVPGCSFRNEFEKQFQSH